MHIHTHYSGPSASDYLDTDSCLAIELLTEVHHLLTHSFQIANDNGFQFCGYPLGRLHTNGHIRVSMCFLPSHLYSSGHAFGHYSCYGHRCTAGRLFAVANDRLLS